MHHSIFDEFCSIFDKISCVGIKISLDRCHVNIVFFRVVQQLLLGTKIQTPMSLRPLQLSRWAVILRNIQRIRLFRRDRRRSLKHPLNLCWVIQSNNIQSRIIRCIRGMPRTRNEVQITLSIIATTLKCPVGFSSEFVMESASPIIPETRLR